jgi:hypothetical protein
MWYPVKMPLAVYRHFVEFQSWFTKHQVLSLELQQQHDAELEQQYQQQQLRLASQHHNFENTQQPQHQPTTKRQKVQFLHNNNNNNHYNNNSNNPQSGPAQGIVLAAASGNDYYGQPSAASAAQNPMQLPLLLTADYYNQRFEAILLYIDDETGNRYNSHPNRRGRSGRQAHNHAFVMISSVPQGEQVTTGTDYSHLLGSIYDSPSAAAFAFQANSEPGWSAFKVKHTGRPLSIYRIAKGGGGFRNHPAMTTVHRDLLAKQVQKSGQRGGEEIMELSTNEELAQYSQLSLGQVFDTLGIANALAPLVAAAATTDTETQQQPPTLAHIVV